GSSRPRCRLACQDAPGARALMLRSIAPDLGFTRDRALQKAQDARGRLLERPPLCCDASRSMRASIAFQSHLTMSNSPDLLVPAAHVCARVLHRCFTHPESRGGRSAEKRSGATAPVGRIMTRYARRLARRLASHDAAIYGPK